MIVSIYFLQQRLSYQNYSFSEKYNLNFDNIDKIIKIIQQNNLDSLLLHLGYIHDMISQEIIKIYQNFINFSKRIYGCIGLMALPSFNQTKTSCFSPKLLLIPSRLIFHLTIPNTIFLDISQLFSFLQYQKETPKKKSSKRLEVEPIHI